MQKMTRRQVLKWGGVGAAGLALPLGVLQIPLARIRSIESMTSPATRPFQRPLPIPPVLAPVRSDGEADYYEITQKPGVAHLLPGLTTPIWGYNGIFPGPTIEARSGRKTIIRQMNDLPVPVSTHLHGGHTPPSSDGHPMDFLLPVDPSPFQASLTDGQMKQFMSPSGLGRSLHMHMQQSKEYVYPNTQRATTLWYHDHRMDFTGAQVYRGLAGFYLIRDKIEDELPLPKGDHEIPLMLTDRSFNADGSFFYPSLDPTLKTTPGVLGKYYNGMIGDTLLVNGAVQPFLEVSATKYRFRLLNASNARVYQLELSSRQSFVQIGSDGGLLPAPAARQTIRISPAERFDVIVDFSQYPVGSQIVLKNLLGEGQTTDIMRFDVVRRAKDDSLIPKTLAPFEALNPANASVTRTFQFFYGLGMWTINGQYFDPNRTDATPRLGATEIWEFTSDGNHPIHLHLVNFQVLSRDGRAPDPEDTGYKDTIFLKAGEKARVIARFEDYRGLYVFHCHNAEHEDMRMMGQFEVM
ncbi:spore coat protein A [Dictyobacter alpinus]|uniref:Spore coat protein A n=1 Tax=Dictyobacter alpinus TaxID=2014873 RepID=A0A402BAP8_9CHLR|nr:multicopper oxidase family protein [Dictyobacter alpinus]GCE28491.1 spore coat protein A [Dictyobacter alpinus]